MKKIAAFVLSACIIVVVAAQTTAVEINKKIVCDDSMPLLDSLFNEYRESPVWAGTDEKSKYSLLINQETGTWTIIQFDKTTTCILGVGEDSRLINIKKSQISL